MNIPDDWFDTKETRYGFKWGPVKIERYFHNDKGWVVIGVETEKEALQIYVTKTGKVRISSDDGEWQKPKA